MTLTFKRYGSTGTTDTLELDETKSSIIDKLNEPTRLSAILTSETAPKIALGNYTTYEGNRYYVTMEPTVRKEHSQLYTVEVDLERSLGLARITILANPVDHRTTFDYTATATEHLQLIVDCLNAKYEEVGLKWTRGAVHCKDTVKHIKYDGATVLGALQQIRETYETDIFADGETLSLGQTDDKTTALPLAYGKGKGLLSGLERHKHTDDTVPTRLYVTGTKRNMTTGRLTLEKDVVLAIDLQSGAIERVTGGVDIKPDGRTLYRTDKAGQYIAEWSPMDKFANSWTRFPTEATYTNEEIYPSHVSTIQTVTKVKDHYEVNSDFDYSSLLIDGEQMQVVFQTGNLAGRDFDAKHFTSTDRLAIVPKEEDDTTLPNDILCPKVGDQYIVTGIKLPDQYIREAERNLTDEALRHLVKLQETRYSYKADIDPVYLHDNHNTIAPQLAVGRYVHLTDPQIAIGDPYVRIVGKRTYLDRPYTPEIELSNEIEPPSALTRVLNELDRQDDGITSLIDRLRLDTVRADSLAKRVGTAEEELRKKLGSEDFSKWQAGDLAKALASKQPAGSYVDPSQLATSQQQAVAEAVKRAGEMDKQLKVGGRNLLVGERFSKETTPSREIWIGNITSIIDNNNLIGETVTWSFDLKCDKAHTFSAYQLGTIWFTSYTDATVEAGEWKRFSFTGVVRDTGNLTGGTDRKCILTVYGGYDSGYFPITRNHKLERGTVATDWTPAPEDLDDSISKVNTSLASLASTLLDHNEGDIPQLFRQLDKHKTDTDKSFEDLATHPLTIDKDGYWQVWSVKDSKYLTTQYPSRGRDGGKGDKGDKGDKPIITLNDKYQLLADGELLSQQSLKGVKGDRGATGATGATGAKGADGKDGHTPGINWDGTKLIIDDKAPVDLRGPQGEAGHSPDPEDVLKTTPFQELLEVKVTDKVTEEVKPIAQELETTKEKADEAFGRASKNASGLFKLNRNIETVKNDLTTATNDITENISNLQSVALTTQQKKDLGYLTGSIRALMSGGSGTDQTLEGLALQRYIALSGDGTNVSAYLASDTLDAVLKAGITDFGTANEREQVEITHQGTGHFGNLYFTGNQIDFRTGRDADPYLSIGADDMVPIATFVKSARVDDTPVSVSPVQLTTSNTVYERTVDVADDGTRLTMTIDELLADCYDFDYAYLKLDGSTIAQWQGNSKMPGDGRTTDDGKAGFIHSPYEAQNLAYERTVSKGRHTVRLELSAKSGKVTFTGFKVKRRYDTGRQQSLLAKSGLRLFGSPDRYLDVDYRKRHYAFRPGQDMTDSYVPNPYTVRIKGGMQVDELDMPGVPLCGASFNENGYQMKSFGEKAKRRGYNRAYAEYYPSGNFYRVFHSIGSTNYMPTIQVVDDNGNDINWNLSARIYAVNANDFAVRILTNGDRPIKHAFSFVAFKTM